MRTTRPILAATEEHFAAYYRLRQYDDTSGRELTSAGWSHAAGSIKRLYEYCRDVYEHPPPFEIHSFTRAGGGSGTTIGRYQARRRNTGSAGTPVTPEWAELLLMGALRINMEGKQDLFRGADRDHAILSLGFGSGLRRHNLANIHLRGPPRSSLPITTMRVADRITKGDAGGDTMVFAHRLKAVHGYMSGARAEVRAGTRWRPDGPLQIEQANPVRVKWVDESGAVTIRRWVDVDAGTRRRLVDVGGGTPVLFINEYTGAPLSYSAYQLVVAGARDFVRAQVEPDFPDQFRLHDLRHTYAVHLAVAIYKGVMADIVEANARDAWVVDHVSTAVEMVKYSLGHASNASTNLYVQTAHRFLSIPRGQFVGEF